MAIHESVIPVFGILFGLGVFATSFLVVRRVPMRGLLLVSVAGGIWAARSAMTFGGESSGSLQTELLDVTALLFVFAGLAGLLLHARKQASGNPKRSSDLVGQE